MRIYYRANSTFHSPKNHNDWKTFNLAFLWGPWIFELGHRCATANERHVHGVYLVRVSPRARECTNSPLTMALGLPCFNLSGGVPADVYLVARLRHVHIEPSPGLRRALPHGEMRSAGKYETNQRFLWIATFPLPLFPRLFTRRQRDSPMNVRENFRLVRCRWKLELSAKSERRVADFVSKYARKSYSRDRFRFICENADRHTFLNACINIFF